MPDSVLSVFRFVPCDGGGGSARGYLAFCFVLSFFLCSPAGFSADRTSAPDPSALKADWFKWFEVDPGPALQERVATVKEYARSVLDQSAGLSAANKRLLQNLPVLLDRYAELKAAAAKPTATQDPVEYPEVYDLGETESLIGATITLERELRFLLREKDNLESTLATARTSLAAEKVAYFALPDESAERYDAGLRVIVSRIQQETSALVLRDVAQQVQRLSERLKARMTQIAEAAGSLAFSEKSWDRLSARETASQKTLSTLQGDLARRKLSSIGSAALTASSAETVRERLAQLEAEVTVETELLELAKLQALLGIRKLDVEGAVKQGYETLRALEELLARKRQRTDSWNEALSALRLTVSELLLNEESAKVRASLARNSSGLAELDALIGVYLQKAREAELFVAVVRGALADHENASERVGRVVSEGWRDILVGAIAVASAPLFEIGDTPVTSFGLLRVVLIVTLAWWISFAIRSALNAVAERRGVNPGGVYSLGRVVHYAILIISVLFALSSIGLDFTEFALFASALGVGIGFGLQALVGNFVAGLILLFERSLKLGDFVELASGVTGEVRDINMRSTLITTNDNVDIVVPNSEFINSRVINWTMREAVRRVHVPFGVAYGSDKDLVRRVVLEAAHAVSHTLVGKAREPQVWLVGFGDSSLDFELVVWLRANAVKRPAAIQAAYLWEIESKFAEHGITIPFPQRDIHIQPPPQPAT